MTKNKEYYVIQNNLGEYSVLKGEERILICTELQYKVTAELFCDELNDLVEENKELKSELQRVYNVATLKKAIDIVNMIYDDLLYETSKESDYARNKVLECLKRLDEFGDNLE